MDGLDVPWKEPRQERSRERVQRITDAARELIREGGLAKLKVNAIASRAQVPIGTFYQFFPDKNAVVGRIFFEQMEMSVSEVYEDCNPGEPLTSPAAQATAVIEPRFRAWSADPVMAEIWSIVQADRTLRHICLESSKVVSEITFAALRPYLRAEVPEDRLRRVCFMIADLFDAAMRTALEFPRAEAAGQMAEYAAMVRNHLGSLLVPPAEAL
ncbi:MAG: TetR/AcrR family transcriptional regulator [Actinobacteria bacterium]|nr:TetR/AcrR family transcriptional regulator [Actinomycetota bacterium]